MVANDWTKAVLALDATRFAAVVDATAGPLKTKEQLSGFLHDAANAIRTVKEPFSGEATGTSATEQLAGEARSSCTVPSAQFTYPRARHDIEFGVNAFTLRGKTALFVLPFGKVTHIIRVPRAEAISSKAVQFQIAIVLNEKISGKQLFVVQTDTKGTLTLRPPGTAAAANAAAAISGPPADALFEALAAAAGQAPTLPRADVFVARNGRPFLRCHLGVAEGALYPLRAGLLFLGTPPLFVAAESVTSITCGRSGGGSGGFQTRFVDLMVETEGDVRHEFGNIPRDDVPSIQAYVASLVAVRAERAKKVEAVAVVAAAGAGAAAGVAVGASSSAAAGISAAAAANGGSDGDDDGAAAGARAAETKADACGAEAEAAAAKEGEPAPMATVGSAKKPARRTAAGGGGSDDGSSSGGGGGNAESDSDDSEDEDFVLSESGDDEDGALSGSCAGDSDNADGSDDGAESDSGGHDGDGQEEEEEGGGGDGKEGGSNADAGSDTATEIETEGSPAKKRKTG